MNVKIMKTDILCDAIVLDGNAILWSLSWPSKGLVEDLLSTFLKYLINHLLHHHVYLIFDRYHDYSIKGVTRAQRTKNTVLQHSFSLKTRLPDRQIALGSIYNKI